MNLQRNFFVITIMCILYMICIIWQHINIDFSSYHLSTPTNRQQLATILTDSVISKGKIITVKTDVLSLKINTYGGDIEQALLLPYSYELYSPKPVYLLETSKEFIYQAQSGLTGNNGLDNLVKGNRPLYTSKQDIYVLEHNQHELLVPLTYTVNNITFTKTFVLKRSDFALTVNYYINNTSTKPLSFMLFGQLKQSINLPETNISSNLSMYRRIAYSTTNKKYKKYNFKELKKCNLFLTTDIGWVAMLQKNFFYLK